MNASDTLSTDNSGAPAPSDGKSLSAPNMSGAQYPDDFPDQDDANIAAANDQAPVPLKKRKAVAPAAGSNNNKTQKDVKGKGKAIAEPVEVARVKAVSGIPYQFLTKEVLAACLGYGHVFMTGNKTPYIPFKFDYGKFSKMPSSAACPRIAPPESKGLYVQFPWLKMVFGYSPMVDGKEIKNYATFSCSEALSREQNPVPDQLPNFPVDPTDASGPDFDYDVAEFNTWALMFDEHIAEVMNTNDFGTKKKVLNFKGLVRASGEDYIKFSCYWRNSKVDEKSKISERDKTTAEVVVIDSNGMVIAEKLGLENAVPLPVEGLEGEELPPVDESLIFLKRGEWVRPLVAFENLFKTNLGDGPKSYVTHIKKSVPQTTTRSGSSAGVII